MNIQNTNFEFNHTVPFMVKAVSKPCPPGKKEDTKIKGYASTFGNLDRQRDVMVRGCFKKSIEKTGGKWPVKLNHSIDIGMNLTAEEDDKGLYVESALYTGENAVDDAVKAVALVKNAIRYDHQMGLSISGIVKQIAIVRDEEAGENYYEIRDFEMLEHSITSIPANPQASITSLKSNFSKFISNNGDNAVLTFLDQYLANQLKDTPKDLNT